MIKSIFLVVLGAAAVAGMVAAEVAVSQRATWLREYRASTVDSEQP